MHAARGMALPKRTRIMNLINSRHRYATALAPTASLLLGESRPDLMTDLVLPDLFRAGLESGPDRTVFITPAKRYTYREVDAAANALAAGLIQKGVGLSDVVGLWFPRGVPVLIAQLAISRTGAAWLPFDADTPVERIRACLADAGAKALLTDADRAAQLSGSGLPVLVDRDIALKGAVPPDPRTLGMLPDHPAYCIYTSGSTGMPKGIEITHRNICHFLLAARETYGLTGSDVMFQGASVAFDLSMEEIWLPYAVGAALFVADPSIMADLAALPQVLTRHGVTVMDTVPTLLSLLPEDVPSLRIIILGGEACPPAIASRWCRPGRRIFNNYGPTEATVVATVAEIHPGEAVTIGRPLPNYSCYVVNEAMELVAEGEEGELLIGGPGIARGYLKRSDLTRQKFVANPFPLSSMDPILYRTGDAVSLDAEGNLRFHGRLDDQVKIRGFRVELGEIEARMTAFPGIRQAAVVLRKDEGIERLIGFVVCDPSVVPDLDALRQALSRTLPGYMVPARLVVIDRLPVMISGKADRKALAAEPLPEAAAPRAAIHPPATATEDALHAAAGQIFPGTAICMEADFFTDLGGHSLLAARFLSLVRQNPAHAGLGLQDVYRDRTLRAMAARLDADVEGAADTADLCFTPPPLARRFLCGLAQAAAMPVVLGLMTAQFLGVFLAYRLMEPADIGVLAEMAAIGAIYLALNILTTVIAITLKWLVIGRTRPGRYPLWGAYYYRWWLSQRLISLIHMKWVQGTPLMSGLLRLLGARIGKDTLLHEIEAGAIDLLQIGDDVSVGGHCGFANAQVIGNELVIGTIEIGDDVYIGSSCLIGPDTRIDGGAELGDLTALGAGSRIGAGERWEGSPARRVGTVDSAALPSPAQAGPLRRLANLDIYLLALLSIPAIGLVPLVPAFFLIDRADDWLSGVTTLNHTWFLPLLALPAALVLVAATVAFIVAIRWLVLPRLKEGVYSVHSGIYLRKWVVSLCSEIALETLSSLYATVYMRGWYRLMGARIGRGSEISTSLSGRHDLVEIGGNCFIADEVLLGEEDIRRGWMTLKRVRTGDQVFVGNSAVVPAGTDIPDRCLIGIKSLPPERQAMRAGETWFGSPAIRLPLRQQFDGGAAQTFAPSLLRQIGRGLFEAFFNLSVPTVSMICLGTLAMEALSLPLERGDYASALLLLPLLGMAMSAAMTLIVVGLKWMMMGTYRPQTNPMWSWFSLRTEAIAVMYSGMAARMLLDFLRGTPFLPWVLRLFGARFGQGVYLDMTDITEFDCICVGDFVAINGFAALQTHLYEDRVMKIGRVSVKDGVTIEAGSTVLYDSEVGAYSRLGPLTIVMKGERIPPHTEWHGAPATRRPRLDGLAMPVMTPGRT